MAARRFSGKSRLGAFLDPMADKLLAVSSFVALSARGPIPVWFVVIVISRDIMISLGSLILFLSEGRLEIAPSRLGKLTTFFQFTTILGTILFMMTGKGYFIWRAALAATALTTVLSGLQYLYRGLGARGQRSG
jgi:cardiolipin synthase